MPAKTNNVYGTITITERTIERFIYNVSTDCYGIVDFVPKNLFDAFFGFFKFDRKSKGINVRCNGDRLFIEITSIVKYGISINAVVDALKESVKYRVEKFTGMIVDTIDVNVIGVRL